MVYFYRKNFSVLQQNSETKQKIFFYCEFMKCKRLYAAFFHRMLSHFLHKQHFF